MRSGQRSRPQGPRASRVRLPGAVPGAAAIPEDRVFSSSKYDWHREHCMHLGAATMTRIKFPAAAALAAAEAGYLAEAMERIEATRLALELARGVDWRHHRVGSSGGPLRADRGATRRQSPPSSGAGGSPPSARSPRPRRASPCVRASRSTTARRSTPKRSSGTSRRPRPRRERPERFCRASTVSTPVEASSAS